MESSVDFLESVAKQLNTPLNLQPAETELLDLFDEELRLRSNIRERLNEEATKALPESRANVGQAIVFKVKSHADSR